MKRHFEAICLGLLMAVIISLMGVYNYSISDIGGVGGTYVKSTPDTASRLISSAPCLVSGFYFTSTDYDSGDFVALLDGTTAGKPSIFKAEVIKLNTVIGLYSSDVFTFIPPIKTTDGLYLEDSHAGTLNVHVQYMEQ